MNLPPDSPDPDLERALEAAKNRPPMTPAERRAQAISWAYGNAAINDPRITREMVAKVYDECYSSAPETEEK